MEENELNLKAEKIVLHIIRDILSKNTEIKDRDDIKMAAEVRILEPLMKNSSEELELEEGIQYLMKILDKKFNKLYEECVKEKSETRKDLEEER